MITCSSYRTGSKTTMPNSPYPSHLPLFKKFHEAGKIPKREDARISVLLEALNWTTPAHIEKSFGRIVRTMGE